MRFSVRSDLGGYAADLPALAGVAGVEVEKPFVLLCGPNGAGKTALMRMARAAMGLKGERAGRTVAEQFGHPLPVVECGGDLGKLATYVSGLGAPGIPRSLPGVLDVEALGWKGQRSFFYDSRADTNLAVASQFDDDLGYHLSRVVGDGNRVSHGQFLRPGWTEAIAWALGVRDIPDPYDRGDAAPARRAVLSAACPDGIRPEERWLFLDEPETALDADVLMSGLSALVASAAHGRLRVFCASHASVFAAGLGRHPSVQVIDLHPGGDWFQIQARALALAADPEGIDRLGAHVAGDLVAQARRAEEGRRREAAAEVSKALKGIPAAAGALLDALHASEGGAISSETEGTGKLATARACETLERRGLADLRGFASRRSVKLTPLGARAARRRAGLDGHGEG